MERRGAIEKPGAMNPDDNHMLAFNGGCSIDCSKGIFRGENDPPFDYLPSFRGTGREDNQEERDLEYGKPGFHGHKGA